jgi:hypothetical protein
MKLELEGLVAFHGMKFVEAALLFEMQYNLYVATQQEIGRPIHKGSPLHNLGLALFYLKKIDQSIIRFLLAYIEDTLQMEFDFEDDADRYPAATTLRDAFLFSLRIFREIKSNSLNIKKEGLWNKAMDPMEILTKVIRTLRLDIERLSRYCGRIPEPGKIAVGFPQPKELRVFIGTNYDVNVGVIPLIKEGIFRKNIAINRGYVPIAVIDAFVPPNATHDVSLLLLHTCGFAMIDVSHPGGQFVEIERIRDYGIPHKNVLLLRQAATPIKSTKLPHVSEMISTLRYKIAYYYDPRELLTITERFLP